MRTQGIFLISVLGLLSAAAQEPILDLPAPEVSIKEASDQIEALDKLRHKHKGDEAALIALLNRIYSYQEQLQKKPSSPSVTVGLQIELGRHLSLARQLVAEAPYDHKAWAQRMRSLNGALESAGPFSVARTKIDAAALEKFLDQFKDRDPAFKTLLEKLRSNKDSVSTTDLESALNSIETRSHELAMVFSQALNEMKIDAHFEPGQKSLVADAVPKGEGAGGFALTLPAAGAAEKVAKEGEDMNRGPASLSAANPAAPATPVASFESSPVTLAPTAAAPIPNTAGPVMERMVAGISGRSSPVTTSSVKAIPPVRALVDQAAGSHHDASPSHTSEAPTKPATVTKALPAAPLPPSAPASTQPASLAEKVFGSQAVLPKNSHDSVSTSVPETERRLAGRGTENDFEMTPVRPTYWPKSDKPLTCEDAFNHDYVSTDGHQLDWGKFLGAMRERTVQYQKAIRTDFSHLEREGEMGRFLKRFTQGGFNPHLDLFCPKESSSASCKVRRQQVSEQIMVQGMMGALAVGLSDPACAFVDINHGSVKRSLVADYTTGRCGWNPQGGDKEYFANCCPVMQGSPDNPRPLDEARMAALNELIESVPMNRISPAVSLFAADFYLFFYSNPGPNTDPRTRIPNNPFDALGANLFRCVSPEKSKPGTYAWGDYMVSMEKQLRQAAAACGVVDAKRLEQVSPQSYLEENQAIKALMTKYLQAKRAAIDVSKAKGKEGTGLHDFLMNQGVPQVLGDLNRLNGADPSSSLLTSAARDRVAALQQSLAKLQAAKPADRSQALKGLKKAVASCDDTSCREPTSDPSATDSNQTVASLMAIVDRIDRTEIQYTRAQLEPLRALLPSLPADLRYMPYGSQKLTIDDMNHLCERVHRRYNFALGLIMRTPRLLASWAQSPAAATRAPAPATHAQ